MISPFLFTYIIHLYPFLVIRRAGREEQLKNLLQGSMAIEEEVERELLLFVSVISCVSLLFLEESVYQSLLLANGEDFHHI